MPPGSLNHAETLRIRGATLARKGDTEGAERSHAASLDWARHQRAKSFELRTATSHARRMRDQGRAGEARPCSPWSTLGSPKALGRTTVCRARGLVDPRRPHGPPGDDLAEANNRQALGLSRRSHAAALVAGLARAPRPGRGRVHGAEPHRLGGGDPHGRAGPRVAPLPGDARLLPGLEGGDETVHDGPDRLGGRGPGQAGGRFASWPTGSIRASFYGGALPCAG